MQRPLSSVILEVLKTRPSLRDFKAYAKTFGATLPPPHRPSAPHVPALGEAPSLSRDPPVVSDRIAVDGGAPPLARAHTALVKVQGPFSDRQLESIAAGLEYLRKLGLLSIIVVDDTSWDERAWRFRADGSPDDSDVDELLPWVREGTPRAEQLGLAEAGQRHCMVREMWRLSNMLASSGADTQPILHPAVRIAGGQGGAPGRTPLALDVPLAHLRAALEAGKTPIIMPMAHYEDDGALRCVCVSADDVMVALARALSRAGEGPTHLSLPPARLMVISREGGVPSHARAGNPHLSINLASEYAAIHASFAWHDTHPRALAHLDMVRDCLAYMPSTSSGVLATHRSPRSLIANLITNKAAHSPSLPFRLLARRSDIQHTPTIVRAGLPVRVILRWGDVDEEKLRRLLEQSFGQRLAPAYFARVAARLECVVVIGDYDGVAIVTNEQAPGDDDAAAPIAYLDKFAVLPKLQGSGAVDFLWAALHDEVQGLGMVDALNNNGGRGGFGIGRDLVWKSRADNPVNRWYFERCSGYVRQRIGGRDWVVFWCDAEDRLARLAGRYVAAAAGAAGQHPPLARLAPGAPTTLPIIADAEVGRLERWTRCLAQIPSAWA